MATSELASAEMHTTMSTKMNKGLQQTEDLIRKLNDYILCGPSKIDQIKIVIRLIFELNSDKFQDFDLESRLDELIDLLIGEKSIRSILLNQFESTTIKKVGECFQQENVLISLKDFFEDIRTVDIHNNTDAGLISKHHHESLFCHLFMAMLVVFTITNEKDDHQVKLTLMFTALVHDIGKPASKIETKKGFYAFPAHGEIGSLILSRIGQYFEQFFSKEEWYAICRTIGVHMCGYHCTDFETENAQMKCQYLSHENELTKKILFHLSFADTFGKFSDDHNYDEFIESRIPFAQLIMQKYDSLLKTFIGNLIMIQGSSATGKSTFSETFARELAEIYGSENVINISRDDCMKYIIMEYCKTKSEYSSTVFSVQSYDFFYAIYASDTKKFSGLVNDYLASIVNEGLRSNKIVILDTQLTMFNAVSFLFKKIPAAEKSFIMSILVGRNSPYTEEDSNRLGATVAKQLSVIGEYSTFSPQSNGLNPAAISSRNTLDDPSKAPVYQPHVALQTGWDSMDLTRQDALKWISLARNSSADSQKEITLETCLELLNKKLQEYNYDMGALEGFMQELGLDLRKYEDLSKCIGVFRKLQTPASPLPGQALQGSAEIIGFLLYKFSYYDGKCHLYDEYIPRHVIVAYNIKEKKFILLRFLMPRGPEALTRLHTTNGVTENESMTANSFSKFPDDHQKILESFANPDSSNDFRVNLSMKVDGAIIAIQFIASRSLSKAPGSSVSTSGTSPPGIRCNIRNIYQILMKHLGGIHSTLVDLCKKLPYLIVISSSGTALIGDNMLDYFVSSFAGAFGLLVDSSLTPTEFFQSDAFINLFMEKCGSLWSEFPKEFKESGSVTTVFEAVVPNRTSSWGRCHDELAVSYDSPKFKLHSMSIISPDGSSYKYWNHTNAPFQQKTFMEPIYWGCLSISYSITMLNRLNQVITGESSVAEFLKTNVPENASMIDGYLDYEGFVAYVSFEKDGVQKCIYMKLKTLVYYMCHKLHYDNIDKILSLPRSAHDHFPLARKLSFFNENLKDYLICVADQIQDYLLNYANNGLIDLLPNEPPIPAGDGKVRNSPRQAFENIPNLKVKINMLLQYIDMQEIANFFVSAGFSFNLSDTELNKMNPDERNEFLSDRHSLLKNILVNILCPWNDRNEIHASINSIDILKIFAENKDRPKSDPGSILYKLFLII